MFSDVTPQGSVKLSHKTKDLSHSRVSQLSPVKSLVHWHVYLLPSCIHVPLLRQGSRSHGGMQLGASLYSSLTVAVTSIATKLGHAATAAVTQVCLSNIMLSQTTQTIAI